MIVRALRVSIVCGVVAAVLVPACGNSSDSGTGGAGATAGTTGTGGTMSAAGTASSSGGGGTSAVAGNAGAAPSAEPVACGSKSCAPVVITFGAGLTIPACCSDAATNHCGLDSSFLTMYGPSFPDPCQPLGQPGSLDTECEDSPMTPVKGTALSIFFKGCCRASGTCGYMLDTIGGLFPLGLGCVDSAPFLEGGTPAACTYSGGADAGPGEGGASGG